MDNEMKEVNRQCSLAWHRGRDFGIVIGIGVTLVFGLFIKIFW